VEKKEGMKDLVPLCEIYEEGRLIAARRVILLMGREKFGPPDAATRKTIQSLTNRKRLERMALRLLRVNSWQELLATR
jgi:hypothetical protein